ncbi:hypothetical protein [Cellulomonas sp. PhB143]|uniref:hypothetical protein n=1 Tax=Cellulomonas sp. PhB143 TaxID=2485186 RepID=UPI000F484276|nr:hypothetical protein [Cellulomonas sp. PhB143]ROS75296.1 hypothetical protein EDF32_1704 [Cellulomonas sp. PhB143]
MSTEIEKARKKAEKAWRRAQNDAGGIDGFFSRRRIDAVEGAGAPEPRRERREARPAERDEGSWGLGHSAW